MRYLLCCLILISASIIPGFSFEVTLPVHRLLQFERGGETFGCQRASLSLEAIIPGSGSLNISQLTHETGRRNKIVVLDVFKTDGSDVNSLFESEAVQGLLFVVDQSSQLSVDDVQRFRRLENALIGKKIEKPVYFVEDDDALRSVLNDPPTHGSYLFEVKTREPSAVKPIKSVNLEGILKGSESALDRSFLPTIMIVAHYDMMGLAPSLPLDMDSRGSGMTALLELMRVFARLYSTVETRGGYDIIFLLTGASGFNFEGAKKFAEKSDSKLENVHFVLCLDALVGEKLYFHFSKDVVDPNIQHFHDCFKRTAKEMDIDVEFSQKKIDVRRNRVWEHEVFEFKHITGATLSVAEDQLSMFGHSWVIPNMVVSSELVTRNTRYIAEALALFLYEREAIVGHLFEGQLALKPDRMNAWGDVFEAEPRYTGGYSKSDLLFDGIAHEMKTFSNVFSEQQFTVSTQYSLFDKSSLNMRVTIVKPIFYDVGVSVSIGAYLVGLFFLLKHVIPH